MNLSLNEVEAVAKRATRGAGHSWGLAEEAALACRWLCLQDLDGVGALAADLEADTGTLAKGVSLSDRAKTLMHGPIELQSINHSRLILPFAANAARLIGSCVSVIGPDVLAVTDGTALHLSGEFPDRTMTLTVKAGGSLSTPRKKVTRAHPTQIDWDTLNRFAHRTYAPATAESRKRGAGAGLSDND